jgi:hypothetical protein
VRKLRERHSGANWPGTTAQLLLAELPRRGLAEATTDEARATPGTEGEGDASKRRSRHTPFPSFSQSVRDRRSSAANGLENDDASWSVA